MSSAQAPGPAAAIALEGALRVLVVDDEALARSRLHTLLAQCTQPPAVASAEAPDALSARRLHASGRFDVALLDIHMPGEDGLSLARSMQRADPPIAVVFVTAHASHAVTAFDLEAVDYLTKPVRAERLQQALAKCERWLKDRHAERVDEGGDALLVQERGRTERVPAAEVLYFKAELKYVTVRTATRSHLMEASLNDLEARFGDRFLRVHRNALVARAALRSLDSSGAQDDADNWVVRLSGIEESLAVSRRQLPAVRQALRQTD